MISSTPPAGRNPLTHRLFVKHTNDVAWLAILFIVAAAAVVAVVAAFTTISTSAWEVAAGIPRWLLGGWGVYATAVYLPLYVAHGYTRREYAVRAPAYVAALSAVGGLAIGAGYALEWVAYRAFDWPQEISPSLLYDSPTQLHLIAVEHLMIMAAWLVAGMLVGAGFYRSELAGLAVLPAGVGTVVVVDGLTVSPDVGPFGFVWRGDVTVPLPASLLIYTVVLAGCGALTWAVVRDLPIRTRNA